MNNTPRQTNCRVLISGVDITDDINRNLKTVQYTDNEEDEADDLQLTIADPSFIWMKSYLNAVLDAAVADSEEATGGEATHTVVSGDTLWGLAERYLGDGARYPEIFNANRDKISDPNLIYVGQVLTIPGNASFPSDLSYKNKGLRMEVLFLRQNWHSDGKEKMLSTGSCALDDISFSGPPNVLTMKASSLPSDTAVAQTEKNQAWEAYYLSAIANEIAGRAGMTCVFESDFDPFYDRVEQTRQTDISFLSTLCHNEGISLKVTANALVLFDQMKYEAAEPVITVSPGCGYTKYKLSTGQNDTQYGSCVVSYTDPLTRMSYSGTYKDPEAESDAQILSINMKCGSNSEAAALAKKMLRLKNKFERSAEFTFPGNPDLVSGLTVTLTGWGMFDAKYIISTATHTVNASGYTTKIKLRRTLEGY